MGAGLVQYDRERLITLLNEMRSRQGRSRWPAAGRRTITWTAAK